MLIIGMIGMGCSGRIFGPNAWCFGDFGIDRKDLELREYIAITRTMKMSMEKNDLGSVQRKAKCL